MNHFLHSILFLLGLFINVSKAHHFIRLVVLAGLGLAGLWMVHTLAQDYNRITGGQGAGKFLLKRSTDNQYPQINWKTVLSKDPASCARSFICQLAAQDDNKLDNNEKTILKMTRYHSTNDSWASKQLLEALKYGELSTNQFQCMKIYKYCPYSSQTMMNLLRIFGG